MAGTISSNFITIDTAEATTNWSLFTWSTAPAINDDISVEGTNAIEGRRTAGVAYALASASAPIGGVDMTVDNIHVYGWIRNPTWPATATKASGGISICISSDASPTITRCRSR